MFLTTTSAVDAIQNITAETGYPPTPEELAEVFDVPVKSIHSTLTPAKRDGTIGYDDNGCFVIREPA